MGTPQSRPAMDWHKCFHHRELANPGYQDLSLASRGALYHLKLLCAVYWNAGHIAVGTKRLKRADVVRILGKIEIAPGVRMERPTAAAVFKELLSAERVTIDRAGFVVMVNWRDEQISQNPAAIRKRRQRERERQERDTSRDASRDRDVDEKQRATALRYTKDQGHAPPSPAAPSLSSSFRDASRQVDEDAEHRSNDTARDDSEFRDASRRAEKKQTAYASSSSSRGAAGEGGDLRAVDVYAGDPLETAIEMTGNRSLLNRRALNKLLADHGEPVFRSALAQLRDKLMTDPGSITGSIGGYFTGIVRETSTKGG